MKARAWNKRTEKFDYFENGVYSEDVFKYEDVFFDWENAEMLAAYFENSYEIYVGDILKCESYDEEEYITEVKMSQGVPCIEVIDRDYDITAVVFAIDNDLNSLEVIGNIHENPELLKGK